jgi:hypothetical protein
MHSDYFSRFEEAEVVENEAHGYAEETTPLEGKN